MDAIANKVNNIALKYKLLGYKVYTNDFCVCIRNEDKVFVTHRYFEDGSEVINRYIAIRILKDFVIGFFHGNKLDIWVKNNRENMGSKFDIVSMIYEQYDNEIIEVSGYWAGFGLLNNKGELLKITQKAFIPEKNRHYVVKDGGNRYKITKDSNNERLIMIVDSEFKRVSYIGDNFDVEHLR